MPSAFAGPHGEAACRYCNTLQDLTEDRRLARHAAGPLRNVCKGTGTYAHTQQPELENLAFSSEPLIYRCPICDQDVLVRTLGSTLDPGGYRLVEHNQTNGRYCEGTGRALSQLDAVAKQVKALGDSWEDSGGFLNN